MKYLRVGIIGVGNMGTAHAFRIADGGFKGVTLIAVFDISFDRMKPITKNILILKHIPIIFLGRN